MASSDSVSLTVKGRGGHGAHPHKSVDPITASAYILAELQTVVSRSVAPLEAAVLTMGKIEGGTAANVIPDTVTMEGTVRTVSRETRAMMEEKIRQIACHGAEALGASCEVEYKKGVPAVICDPAVVERIRKAAVEELGSETVSYTHLHCPYAPMAISNQSFPYHFFASTIQIIAVTAVITTAVRRIGTR